MQLSSSTSPHSCMILVALNLVRNLKQVSAISGGRVEGCLGGKNGLLHPGRVGSSAFSSSQLNWTGASGAFPDAVGASVDAVGCSEAVGASPESPEP